MLSEDPNPTDETIISAMEGLLFLFAIGLRMIKAIQKGAKEVRKDEETYLSP